MLPQNPDVEWLSASRRAALRAVGVVAASWFAVAFAAPVARAADAYPSRPVTIVVPFAAGGSADVYARVIAQKLGEAMGQTFVVDDRPGGGSVIGTNVAAKSTPDGYTLLLMSNTQTVNESLIKNKPFVLMRDFAPIAPINYSDLVLVVGSKVPAKNLTELIALAKSKPGAMSYASSGPGTPYHMAGELFKVMAGVDILHVPYKGSSSARTDVLGGQVDMMFDAVPTMSEHIRSGKVRAIATTGLTRSTVMPEVPTMDESGVPKYEAVIWLGLLAPKGTPPAIVERLNAAVAKIVADPQVKKSWAEQGTTPMTMSTSQFSKYIADDITKWARIVQISGAKVD